MFFDIFFQKSLIEDKEVSNEIIQNQKKTDNQINDLKYFSRDEKGNSYLLNAKTGYPDEENNYIINLNNVDAKITFFLYFFISSIDSCSESVASGCIVIISAPLSA